jgi:hypothetical protein
MRTWEIWVAILPISLKVVTQTGVGELHIMEVEIIMVDTTEASSELEGMVAAVVVEEMAVDAEEEVEMVAVAVVEEGADYCRCTYCRLTKFIELCSIESLAKYSAPSQLVEFL